MGESLERAQSTYESHRDEWMREHPGKFILIVDSEVLGFYDSDLQAYAEGLACRGNVPMFIRRLDKGADEFVAPAMSLGLIHAHK